MPDITMHLTANFYPPMAEIMDNDLTLEYSESREIPGQQPLWGTNDLHTMQD